MFSELMIYNWSRKSEEKRLHRGASPCGRHSVQTRAVDFDLVFQYPSACHDADLQHQIYEKKWICHV